MKDPFPEDLYPEKLKILFIGLAQSTHTQSWIDLLADAEINMRLFGLPGGYPPTDWGVRTYVTAPRNKRSTDTQKYLYSGLAGRFQYLLHNGFTLKPVSNLSKSLSATLALLVFWPWFVLMKVAGLVSRDHLLRSPEEWLVEIIRKWQPDIVHTLGLYDYQGGLFYYGLRKQYQLSSIGVWVLQLRGGSDLTLRRLDPEYMDEIRGILTECDWIISDNRVNMSYAAELGLSEDKFAEIVPVPGSGGINVHALSSAWSLLPSLRKRIIIWPKAYERQWSKALPVLEGIKLAWDEIKPCEIYMLVTTQDVREWIRTLPEDIREHCHIFDRVPREQVLEYLQQARVLLAPSLIDGVPNSLYEAMACGAFPIVSPLVTIDPIVDNEENVLFARNLYPDEIAQALIRAMSDDDLVDRAAERNLELVKMIADREVIRPRVLDFYQRIADGDVVVPG